VPLNRNLLTMLFLSLLFSCVIFFLFFFPFFILSFFLSCVGIMIEENVKVLMTMRAKWKFKARKSIELDLKKGEVVEVVYEGTSGWYVGTTKDGRTGRFPSNYCVVVGSKEDTDEEGEAEGSTPDGEHTLSSAETSASRKDGGKRAGLGEEDAEHTEVQTINSDGDGDGVGHGDAESQAVEDEEEEIEWSDKELDSLKYVCSLCCALVVRFFLFCFFFGSLLFGVCVFVVCFLLLLLRVRSQHHLLSDCLCFSSFLCF
jgi:Variant SH3 domain